MRLPVYPEYGATRDAWVGSAPIHWKFLRADFTTVSNKEQISDEAMEGIEVLHYSIPNVQKFGTAQVEDGNDIDSAKLRITTAQLLISKLNPRKATLCIAEPDSTLLTVCSGEFVPIIPEGELTLKYCYYTWISDKVTKLLSSLVQSVTRSHQRVSPEDITKLPWAWPPKREQQQIAAFLDWKTEQIDALIGKKKQLLEKLREKRIAAITQAVTQGLNPAAMRDSGIPWLGQVPEHWEVKRIKFIGLVGNGSTPSRENPLYWDDGYYPWLNSSVVNQEAVTMADQFVTADALAECHLPIVKPPAVLIGITGEGKTRGMATTLLFEATINQHLAYFKPAPSQAVVGFVRRVFDMAYPYLRSESDGGGSTKGAITCEQINELSIPVPPIAEQETIATYLDAVTLRIDRLVQEVESAIDRLTEYRTGLITAATTGKIDVRKVTIPQPTA
jgi:type I restriction enzyme S subunit